MISPQSCTARTLSTLTTPVSMSTSTSANWHPACSCGSPRVRYALAVGRDRIAGNKLADVANHDMPARARTGCESCAPPPRGRTASAPSVGATIVNSSARDARPPGGWRATPTRGRAAARRHRERKARVADLRRHCAKRQPECLRRDHRDHRARPGADILRADCITTRPSRHATACASGPAPPSAVPAPVATATPASMSGRPARRFGARRSFRPIRSAARPARTPAPRTGLVFLRRRNASRIELQLRASSSTGLQRETSLRQPGARIGDDGPALI